MSFQSSGRVWRRRESSAATKRRALVAFLIGWSGSPRWRPMACSWWSASSKSSARSATLSAPASRMNVACSSGSCSIADARSAGVRSAARVWPTDDAVPLCELRLSLLKRRPVRLSRLAMPKPPLLPSPPPPPERFSAAVFISRRLRAVMVRWMRIAARRRIAILRRACRPRKVDWIRKAERCAFASRSSSTTTARASAAVWMRRTHTKACCVCRRARSPLCTAASIVAAAWSVRILCLRTSRATDSSPAAEASASRYSRQLLLAPDAVLACVLTSIGFDLRRRRATRFARIRAAVCAVVGSRTTVSVHPLAASGAVASTSLSDASLSDAPSISTARSPG